MGVWILFVIFVLLLTSCGGQFIGKKAPAHKPGVSTTVRTPSNITQTLRQSENPAETANQTFKRTEVRNETIPAGSAVTSTTVSTNGTNIERIVLSAPLQRSFQITEESGTTIGSAQPDTARGIWAKSMGAAELLTAKVRSMRPVQYMGFFLLVCSLAMFHPAVRAVTQSTTLQMVVGGAGVALIFLPMVIAGNETLMIALGIGIPTLWFALHRHGQMKGQLQAFSGEIITAPKPASKKDK